MTNLYNATVDPRKVKDPKELPYMQRPGGSADDSDIKKKGGFSFFGGKKKAEKKEPPAPEKKTNWWIQFKTHWRRFQ